MILTWYWFDSGCKYINLNQSFIVSVTSSGAIWVGLHQFGIMKMKSEKRDYCSIPMSIYMFGLVLFGVSSFQYFNNTALRKFTQKNLRNKIVLFTSFRDSNILRFSREGVHWENRNYVKQAKVLDNFNSILRLKCLSFCLIIQFEFLIQWTLWLEFTKTM